ncbi:MAG: hypothetical protein LBJ71_03490 [Holosporaceae bacterium]|jgi:chromosome segregation ATPase|nr:hypothetical protein [Holosporaceae bacterium]
MKKILISFLAAAAFVNFQVSGGGGEKTANPEHEAEVKKRLSESEIVQNVRKSSHDLKEQIAELERLRHAFSAAMGSGYADLMSQMVRQEKRLDKKNNEHAIAEQRRVEGEQLIAALQGDQSKLQDQLEQERNNHIDTQNQLIQEQANHANTQIALARSQDEHAEVRKKFEEADAAHAGAMAELAQERADHAATKDAHAAANEALEQSQEEHAAQLRQQKDLCADLLGAVRKEIKIDLANISKGMKKLKEELKNPNPNVKKLETDFNLIDKNLERLVAAEEKAPEAPIAP